MVKVHMLQSWIRRATNKRMLFSAQKHWVCGKTKSYSMLPDIPTFPNQITKLKLPSTSYILDVGAQQNHFQIVFNVCLKVWNHGMFSEYLSEVKLKSLIIFFFTEWWAD